jgi:hypothetical protein
MKSLTYNQLPWGAIVAIIITIILVFVLAFISHYGLSDYYYTKQEIKRETNLPIYLPRNINDYKTLYPWLVYAEKDMYEISFDLDKDCLGADACNFATILVDRNKPLLSSDEEVSFPEEKVLLGNNVIGHFLDFNCGASCGSSSLWWQQDDYYVTVELHAGSKEETINFANFLIKNR